jgi:hypothetical protein
LLFFAGGGLLPGQTFEYFPLQAGNTWVYRVTEGRIRDTRTVRVDSVEQRSGRSYFKVEFFGREVLLRNGDADTILVLNPETNLEDVWLDFGLPTGQDYATSIDQCTMSAAITDKAVNLQGLAGSYHSALSIAFRSKCADAGIESQVWAPYIGLVQHTESNITGALKYELSYSRTGATNLQGGQVAFSVGIDQTLYKAGPVNMEVRLTLRNTQEKPLQLVFPSGQEFDLKIYNARGDNAYTWSADKLFHQAFHTVTVQPGAEKTFAFTAEIPNLTPGQYLAHAFLTSHTQYNGTIGFEVAEVTIE